MKRETIKIETKMKKQMKRTVYEAPVTERFQVELEGNFCGSVDVENPNTENGKINAHEINGGFGGTNTDGEDLGFSSDGWD